MKKFVCAVAALAASTSVASAADFLDRGYIRAPGVSAPIYSWAGFYLGGNIGYGWENTQTNLSGFLPIDVGSKNAGFFTVGGQAGYNAQFDAFVIGLETDLNWIANPDKRTTFVAPGNTVA